MGPWISSKYPFSMVQKEKSLSASLVLLVAGILFSPRENGVETLWWHTKRLVCEPGPSAKNI